MKHFKWEFYHLYRFIVNDGITYRLYPFVPRDNEFERRLKYRLCETWQFEDDDAVQIREICRVCSIKEAEKAVDKIINK